MIAGVGMGSASEPIEAITAISELGENTLVMLRDFHLFLEDGNPVLLRALKDELKRAKSNGRVLVVVGCRQVLPPELEREFVVLDFALPGKVELENARLQFRSQELTVVRYHSYISPTPRHMR